MKHFELCCSLHTHVCTTRDIKIVSKSHFHDDLHLRVKMENFMLSRNAHKRNSRAHFQHVSWIFSLCTLNYRAKKTIAMIYLHNFSAEKKSGNWRENLHAPKNTNCAFCLSATQIAEWNTCEYLRFIMLYIIASPENRQRVRFIVEI